MPSSPTLRPGQALLLHLAKPLFELSFGAYARELRSAPFPLDEPVLEIHGAGHRPDRLLFIGSIAVSGVGVLHQGMKASSRTAANVATERGNGVVWSELTSPTLTSAQAAAMPELGESDADVAVVILGICDTLLVTDPETWAADLATMVDRLRTDGRQTSVVFAGIPPLDRFRSLTNVARRLTAWQIERLNEATARFVAATPDTTYVPFPRVDVGSLFVEEALSWATMHKLWGRAIAPAVSGNLARHPLAATISTAS